MKEEPLHWEDVKSGSRETSKDGMLIGLFLTQLIVEETENLLEKWKHPDPYRAPTAPGGSKYERNLPVPSTERKYFAIRVSWRHGHIACKDLTCTDTVLAAPPHMHL